MIVSGQAKRPVGNVAMVAMVALLLGGCESSSRLGSLMPGSGYRSPAQSTPAAPAPLTPAPAGEVESSALPPLPGSGTTSALPPPTGAPGMNTSGMNPSGGVATAPGVPVAQPQSPVVSPAIPPAPPQVANATPPSAPASAGPPTRTALVGNWSVSEANGARCKITLSSAPKLDLYGAGTSGCQNKELQRINAWELAGNEVILYEPGGGVVARLRGAGGQNYAGATAKSGAPVNMSK